MSPKNVNSGTFIKALMKDGFEFVRQSGSHQIYRKDSRYISVPYHHKGQTIPDGTLSGLIRSTGWTDEDLIKLKIKRK